MEESLKSVNLLHQLILGISAAVLALGLVPDPTKHYQAALHEVSALRQLSMTDYDQFAAVLVPADSGSEVRGYAQPLKRGISTPMSPQFVVPRQVYVMRPKEGAPLSAFFDFFKGDNQVTYVKFLPESLALSQTFRNQYSLLSPDQEAQCAPTRLALAAPDGSQLAPQDYSQSPIRFLSATPQAGAERVFVSTAKSAADMNCIMAVQAVIDSVPVTIPGNHAQEWLCSKRIDPGSWLADLEKLSDQIASKTPADASRFLEDKINAPKREVSFLGVSVDEDTAVWVGPSLVLLLMLFFLSHVRHVRAAARPCEGAFDTFPWIGLFTDRLSKILTYASVILLPAASDLLLVTRPWRSTGKMTDLGDVGLAISVAAMIPSVLAAQEIHRLTRLRALWDREAQRCASDDGQKVVEKAAHSTATREK